MVSILLLYDPAIILLGIYLELKTYVNTKTCAGMFVAALFIVVKTGKKTRCPSVGDKLWINCGTLR